VAKLEAALYHPFNSVPSGGFTRGIRPGGREANATVGGLDHIIAGHLHNIDAPIELLRLIFEKIGTGKRIAISFDKTAARVGGNRARATSAKSSSCNWVSKLGNSYSTARSASSIWPVRKELGPPLCLAYGQHAHRSTSQACAAPTVSAILAPRLPSGFGCPVVLSRAV
jgi:hypothetical protein